MDFDELRIFLAETQPDQYGNVLLRDAVVVPFLQSDALWIGFRPQQADRFSLIEALNRLTTLSNAVRQQCEQAIYAFYLEEIEDGRANFESPQAQLDWEAGFNKSSPFKDPRAAESSGDVWSLVRFGGIRPYVHRTTANFVLEVIGEAAWDGEHGIALHFEGGARLIGVAGLDDDA